MKLDNKWRVLPLALLVVTSVVIAGCGGGSIETGSTTSGHVTIPSTLKAVVGSEFGSLDPNLSTGEQEWMATRLYVATLTQYGEGKQGQGELAESLVPSDNFKTWTATLKPGLKFSDGTPITANDVKATFERIIEGAGYPMFATPSLEAVSVKGARTVVFSLGSPEANFPTAVSMPDFGIYPASGLKEGSKFFAHPISAGPYALESFKPRRVRLTQNPMYEVGKKPRPKAVEFTVVEDPGTRLAQVKTGQANWAFDLPAGLIPQITSPAELQVQEIPGLVQLIMNNQVKPFTDPRVRRAISYALDRESISSSVFAGKATPNSRYWPSFFPERAEPEEGEQEPTANVAAAERELKGTECEEGCKLTLNAIATVPYTQPLELLIQQQLKSIGIEVNPSLIDYATQVEVEETGEYEMLIDNFLAPAPAEEILARGNIDPAGPFKASASFFESKKVEEVLAQLSATPVDERAQVGKELGELYAKERPWASIANLTKFNASNLPESVVHGEVYALSVE